MFTYNILFTTNRCGIIRFTYTDTVHLSGKAYIVVHVYTKQTATRSYDNDVM